MDAYTKLLSRKQRKNRNNIYRQERNKLIEVNKEEMVIEFYNIETLYFEITSLEEMTEKVKKYMLSEAGVLELEAYIKKKIGEEIDELFLKGGDVDEQ